jgi:hypothetical protein
LYEQLVNYSDLQTRHGHQQLNRVSRAASVIATLTSSENNSLAKTNLGCTHRRLVNARILASARKHGIADEEILDAFTQARALGATWEQIGKSFGLTAELAQNKYSALISERG